MAESIKTKHENWLRVVWGLLYVRNGLQGYVDTKGKQQYQTFMKNVNANCNSQTCDQCQVNCGCQKGIQIPISQFNKGHFCDEMKKEIQNNHAKKPFWNNTDSTKWQDPNKGYWEVAKCFLSTAGYFDTTGPIEVDASGLLSICINSSIVKQQITDIQAFIDVRNIRNKTLHDARYEMDGKKADDCLEKMITVLEDQNELKHDTDAQKAANHIRKIKDKTEKTPANMIEDLHKCLQTNFDVDKAIKEIECSMYGRLRKELKEYVDDVVEGKVKIVFEQEMRKLKDLHERGTDESEDNVEDLRQRLAKYYHERLNHALISPMFLEEKLDKFYVPPKIFEKNARNIGVAEKRKGTPVTSYRHLICKTGKFGDLVFIVGEAGMGKSSCAAMCALKWANQVLSTNTSNEPEEYASHRRSLESTELEKLIQSNSDLEHMFLTNAKLDDQFQDDTFFQKVEFLFHLILRDSCHLCDLTDMIQDQLIQSIYPLDKTIAAVSTLHSVLSNKKCVIIVDGLDEWTHPNDTNCRCLGDKEIPHLAPNIDATVLITSRPWKMSQQRVKDSNINTYLEIEGTADKRLLIQKTINALNRTLIEKKTLLDFVKFVHRMTLTRLLSVPIISILLVCLWFEGIQSFSICNIYAYTIEMMFREKYYLVPISQNNIPFLRCFEQTKLVQRYYSIVMEIAELAFTTLFSSDQTSSMVFKKVDNLKHDTLLFVLKSGILQESKSASLIRKSSSYSFVHKTVQEFFAAIYISYHPKELKRVVQPFYEKKDDMSDISQVFIFMCGLNIELANKMSVMITKHISNSKIHYWSSSIQETIVSGYKEAKASKQLDIQLSLTSFNLSSAETEIVNNLLLMNKSKILSIRVSSDISQAKFQEVINGSKDTLTYVWIYDVAGQYNLSECNNLQDLSIFGSKTTEIAVNTNFLESLHLSYVSKAVECSILKSLTYRSVNLKYLKMETITNVSLFCQTLPLLTNLEKLSLGCICNTHLSLLTHSSLFEIDGIKSIEGLGVSSIDLGDHVLLLPASLRIAVLQGVTMTGRSLRRLVENSPSFLKFLLLNCNVDPNVEYEAIKR